MKLTNNQKLMLTKIACVSAFYANRYRFELLMVSIQHKQSIIKIVLVGHKEFSEVVICIGDNAPFEDIFKGFTQALEIGFIRKKVGDSHDVTYAFVDDELETNTEHFEHPLNDTAH